MQRVSLNLLAVMFLVGLMMLPTPSRAAGEPHPLIRRAVAALEAARGDLQNAAHDYCGHRVEALEATNKALGQLQQALACDSKKGKGAAIGNMVDPEPAATRGGEPHPNIYKAINALGAAEGDLQNAAHDYCGHRAESLGAVQHALAQLKLAIQCDKKK
jgi:hypothetical protein